jgi:hypothetical protein
MSDIVFNIAKGAVAEMCRDSAASFGVLLLKTAQADATLQDYDTIADILAAGGGTANVEADFTSYARKTGLTGTLTVDDTNNWTVVDLVDQTWSPAGGASNNTLAKLIVYYQNSAADSGRVPCVALDFVLTTDGSDVTAQFNASGFYKAA